MSYRARAQGVSGRRIRVGAAFVAVLALAAVAAQFAGRPAQAGDAGDGRGRVGGVGGLVYVGRVADGDRDGRGEPIAIRGTGSLAVHDQGQALYLASELGLQVFRRDARSGRLDRVLTLASDIDLSRAAVAWDAAHGRLLADDCGTWRAFPLARGLELPDGTELAESTELIVEDDPYTCGHDLLIGADGASSYYRVGQGRVDVFASDPKDALRFAQTLEAGGLSRAALHPGGSHLYALADDRLLVFERDGHTGLFARAESHAMFAAPATALAVATDGTHMMVVEGGALGVFDLRDPGLPHRVAAANLPAAVGVGGCRFAQAVPGAAAVDVFCPGAVLGAGWRTGGGALETWSIVPENGDLAHPRDAMPPFGAPTAVAASPDGRHVYVATPAAGVLIFARGGGERAAVPRDAARPEAVRGRGRYSAQDESGPDFLINSLQAVRTSFSGRQFKLKVTVRNRADVANDEPTLRYYRSADASLVPADDTVVDTKTFDRGHGESIVWSKALEPESDAYYYACVDTMAGELDTTNNCSTAVFVSAGTAAETYRLVASAAVSNSRPSVGATFDLTVTVSNEGGGQSPSAKLAYYRSDDSDIDGQVDQKLGETDVAQLDGGTSTTKTIAVTAPSSPDTHYYGACVAAAGAASDSGNICSAGVRVDVVADGSSEPVQQFEEHSFDLLRLDVAGATHADGALYLLNAAERRVRVHRTDGHRRPERYLNLDDGNGHPTGIAHADGALFVTDWADGKVYAYDTDGQRLSGRDFELDDDNRHPRRMAYADGVLFVADGSNKIYAYGTNGQRLLSRDFEPDYGEWWSPVGMAHADGALFVAMTHLDGDGHDRVYAYGTDGRRLPDRDFSLGDTHWSQAMAHADGVLFVADDVTTLDIRAFGTDGRRLPDRDLDDLHRDNEYPVGIAYADGAFFVADASQSLWLPRPIYAYGTDGRHLPDRDFDLDPSWGSIAMVHVDGALFVAYELLDTVYAYDMDGRHLPDRDFDLHDDNGNAVGIAHADDAFFVADGSNHRIYAYGTDGQRLPDRDFDLDGNNEDPGGMAHADGVLFVADGHAETVYAYGTDGRRLPDRDFDLDDRNSRPEGMAHAHGALFVVNGWDRKVYAYGTDGRRLPGYFDISGATQGMTHADSALFVADNDKVYAYSTDGRRLSDRHFDLDTFISPGGMAHADGVLFVADKQAGVCRASEAYYPCQKVFAYGMDGQRLPDRDFDLDGENEVPLGMTHADGVLFVVDWSDKVYAYGTDGQRLSDRDFHLVDGNRAPRGIAHADGVLLVADWSDDKVYAYSTDGRRLPDRDFEFHAIGSPRFIAHADGVLFVEAQNRVYAYQNKVYPNTEDGR